MSVETAESEVGIAEIPEQEKHGSWAWDWTNAGWVGVLALASALRLWKLNQNGLGNLYYAAAVRSMLQGWSQFFFNAFDPGGYVSVDKPPAGLWVQTASAWLLGYRGISLMLPQAIAGIAAVAVVYYLVRRTAGPLAALVAGLSLAVMPISVAIDRENLPDSLLVLSLLLAAWAFLHAAETGRRVPLLVGAALVGVGFNIKMLAAFVVVPAFYFVYLLGANLPLWRRLANLTLASLVLVAFSLSWSVAVDLTPADQRPYVGGSTNNSALGLALGYNGLGRILSGFGNMGPPGGGRGPGGMPFPPGGMGPGMGPFPFPMPPDEGSGPPGAPGGFSFPPPLGDFEPPPGMPMPPPGMGMPPGMAMPPGMPMPPGGPGGGFRPPFPFGGGGPPGFGGFPGPLRLINNQMGGQFAWLLPLAIVGLIAAARSMPWTRPLHSRAQSLVLWTVWLGTYAIVLSFSRGIIHPYYTVMLAAPLAALVGIGASALWSFYQQGGRSAWFLPIAFLVTAMLQAYLLTHATAWRYWIMLPMICGVLVSSAGLLWVGPREVDEEGSLRFSRGARLALLGLCAIFLAPTAWALTPVLAKGNGMMPAADPDALTSGRQFFPPGMDVRPEQTKALVDFLKANRDGARYLVAAPNSMLAAPIIIETGEAVMAMGGFMGADPILTAEKFEELVRAGVVKYALSPPFGMPGPGMGPGGPGNWFSRWVREHGEEVDPALYSAAGDESATETEAMPGPPPWMPAFPGPMGLPGRFRPTLYKLDLSVPSS